ncbi:MAG: 50S ribosomal protein L9 [Peptostreptococcaceae bacterium]|nr:50S ribosomal protein L9 [Peptostreptococcaceae bacterium]
MIIILLKDVKGTGKTGEVVKVSDGYARNLLIPKGFAMEATEGNVRSLEKQKSIAEGKKADELSIAKELAEKIGNLSVHIKTKSGEGGKLFGSITSKDIAEALKEQHKIDIDKKKFLMPNPIKTAGETTVEIKIFHEVVATLKVGINV